MSAAWTTSVLALLLDTTLKATLLLILAGAASLLLRHRSAALRHALWAATAAGLLALPLLSAALPWHLSVLPRALSDLSSGDVSAAASPAPATSAARRTTRSEVATGGVAELAAAASAPGAALPGLAVRRPAADAPAARGAIALPIPTPQAGTAESRSFAHAPGTSHLEPAGREPAPLAATAPARDANAAIAHRSSTDAAGTAAVLALFLWALGAFILLGRLALGHLVVGRYARRAEPLEAGPWRVLASRLTLRLALWRDVRLLRSGEVRLPVTWGLRRPVVLLPEEAETWSHERRSAVLLHELAHVQRRDALAQLVGTIACALYWFHPFVWRAVARMQDEGERACDDSVLRAGTRASDYAGHLLDLVRSFGDARAPVPALPMAQRSSFEGRLLAILDPARDRGRPARRNGLALAGVAALVVAPIATLRPAPAPAATPAAAEAARPAARVESAGAPSPAASMEGTQSAWAAALAAGSFAQDTGKKAKRRTHAGGAPVAPAPPDLPLSLLAELALGPVDVPLSLLAEPDLAPVAPEPPLSALLEPRIATALSAAPAAVPAPRPMPVPRPPEGLLLNGSAFGPLALQTLPPKVVTPALLGSDGLPPEALAAAPTGLWRRHRQPTAAQKRALASLVPALHDGDRDVRVTALRSIAELGGTEDPATLRALVPLVSDADVEVRRYAVRLLGESGDSAAVDALISALRKDTDAEVRRTAAWSLGSMRAKTAVPALMDAVRQDADAEVKTTAAWALGQLRDARAVPALSAALGAGGSKELRRTAAWALGELRDPASVPALQTALKDPDASVRRTAAWALGELHSDAAVAGLSSALRVDGEADVRRMAAWALGQARDSAAVPALSAATTDKDPEVRRMAIWGLSRIDGNAALDALVKALKSDDPEIRRSAARALGRVN